MINTDLAFFRWQIIRPETFRVRLMTFVLFFVFVFFVDIMKSKSNPDFMKKQSKQPRGLRSKVSSKFLFPCRH